NFTVDARLESVVNWYLQGIRCIVLPLNLFPFYLIYAKTPKHSHTYRYFVLHMQSFQLWSTLIDLHVGILFLPMPLLPLLGGYCNGVLCKAGLPAHYSAVICLFVLSGIFNSMGISIFYRHQLILPEGHWLRIGKVPAITSLFVTPNTSVGRHFLEEVGLQHYTFLIIRISPESSSDVVVDGKHNWMVYDTHSFPLTWIIVEASVLVAFYPALFCVISIHLYRGIARVLECCDSSRSLSKKTQNHIIDSRSSFSVFFSPHQFRF
ncbi:hypothetical protein PENTCL1PPCAC_14248, partial [Pristionchus entomophagus]